MKPMESKQTAVDWLVEKIQQANPSFKFDALIRQSKAMEKEQMKDAVLEQSTKHERLRKIFEKQFEEYYNETYGK